MNNLSLICTLCVCLYKNNMWQLIMWTKLFCPNHFKKWSSHKMLISNINITNYLCWLCDKNPLRQITTQYRYGLMHQESTGHYKTRGKHKSWSSLKGSLIIQDIPIRIHEVSIIFHEVPMMFHEVFIMFQKVPVMFQEVPMIFNKVYIML